MKNIVLFIFLLLFVPLAVFGETLLKGQVTQVPQGFFGVWRVTSKLVDTDSPAVFKNSGIDLWNISRLNDVIYLSNPFSGATAEVEVNKADREKIIFTKNGKYDNKILTDTVSIIMKENSFTGIDELELKTISDINGKIMKTERAKYSVSGEKISE